MKNKSPSFPFTSTSGFSKSPNPNTSAAGPPEVCWAWKLLAKPDFHGCPFFQNKFSTKKTGRLLFRHQKIPKNKKTKRFTSWVPASFHGQNTSSNPPPWQFFESSFLLTDIAFFLWPIKLFGYPSLTHNHTDKCVLELLIYKCFTVAGQNRGVVVFVSHIDFVWLMLGASKSVTTPMACNVNTPKMFVFHRVLFFGPGWEGSLPKSPQHGRHLA